MSLILHDSVVLSGIPSSVNSFDVLTAFFNLEKLNNTITITINKLNNTKGVSSISAFDFSTLYTNMFHDN